MKLYFKIHQSFGKTLSRNYSIFRANSRWFIIPRISGRKIESFPGEGTKDEYYFLFFFFLQTKQKNPNQPFFAYI